VDRIEAFDAQPHYVVRTGTREIFFRVVDLAISVETVNRQVVRQVSPASTGGWAGFPLTAGKSWEMKYHEERPVDRQSEDIQRSCTAESEETVTVPAGIFNTIRISCKNLRNGAWTVNLWYSPEVGHIVRDETAVTGGRRVRELISYRRR
jgi:hypothetical protein